MYMQFLNRPKSGIIHIMSEEDFVDHSIDTNPSEVEFLDKKLQYFDSAEISGYRNVKFWGWFPSFDSANLKKQLNVRGGTKNNVMMVTSPDDQKIEELHR